MGSSARASRCELGVYRSRTAPRVAAPTEQDSKPAPVSRGCGVVGGCLARCADRGESRNRHRLRDLSRELSLEARRDPAWSFDLNCGENSGESRESRDRPRLYDLIPTCPEKRPPRRSFLLEHDNHAADSSPSPSPSPTSVRDPRRLRCSIRRPRMASTWSPNRCPPVNCPRCSAPDQGSLLFQNRAAHGESRAASLETRRSSPEHCACPDAFGRPACSRIGLFLERSCPAMTESLR